MARNAAHSGPIAISGVFIAIVFDLDRAMAPRPVLGVDANVPAGSGMSGMNLERIGGNVHIVGYCGLICQSSPTNRLVLSFTPVNGGPHDMGQTVVFNSR